jgi:hypothetical protein
MHLLRPPPLPFLAAALLRALQQALAGLGGGF